MCCGQSRDVPTGRARAAWSARCSGRAAAGDSARATGCCATAATAGRTTATSAAGSATRACWFLRAVVPERYGATSRAKRGVPDGEWRVEQFDARSAQLSPGREYRQPERATDVRRRDAAAASTGADGRGASSADTTATGRNTAATAGSDDHTCSARGAAAARTAAGNGCDATAGRW
jgi:hypothetical protein